MIDRAVHTFCFRTFFESDHKRGLGGFPSARNYWYSHTLSALLLRKHFGYTEFVTDKYGAEIASQKLKLPYNAIRVLPEFPKELPASVWNAPKMYSYLEQKE